MFPLLWLHNKFPPEHKGIKQPLNLLICFVDGEFIEGAEWWLMSEASAGGLEGWGLESSAGSFTYIPGRCCLLTERELSWGCQEEHLHGASWLLHNTDSVRRERAQ